jgi:hypothetical protein
MKSLMAWLMVTFLTIASLCCIEAWAGPRAQQQRPEVKRVEGHVSPLMVKITYGDDKTRTVMLVATGYSSWYSHQMKAVGPGESKVNLWLDSIKKIVTTEKGDYGGMFLTLKNGTERELAIDISYAILLIAGETGDQEQVYIKKVKSIDFLDAPRKDRDGNAMFPNWRYSPYTGEKLPDM